MSHKHVLFQSEAREKVLHGATAIARAVRVTLGSKSKCTEAAMTGVSDPNPEASTLDMP
jgi:hypothetical protein